MSDQKKTKRSSPALAILLGLATVILYFAFRPGARPSSPDPPDPPLSALGSPPEWADLSAYAGSMTTDEFERLLTGVFVIGENWREYFTIQKNAVVIRTSQEDPEQAFELRLAEATPPTAPPRYWRPAGEMPPAPSETPMQGVRIALDPGHIGGDYARLEERWFQLELGNPVKEGEMALRVAQLVKPQLESLGATVTLVRDRNAPLTSLRESDFRAHAAKILRDGTPADQRSLSRRLFYRTAEIRERAKLVNEVIKPDVVVCIHFNAEAWGDPSQPRLTNVNHFHLILNGAYTPDELALDDVRFELLQKLLQGTHSEEAALSATMAAAFSERTNLPPYQYKPDSSRALNIDHNPYLWARNLLANRLYQCPVVFLEPYVMNSREVYDRIQAGDYEGSRLVAGQERPSLYREYADAVVHGLQEYYREQRPGL